MQFNSIKWLGLVALSAAILIVFVHHELRAEDDNNSASGRRRVERIEDSRSTCRRTSAKCVGTAEFKRNQIGTKYG